MKNIQKSIVEKGYIDIPIDDSIDLVEGIKKLKVQKNAIILAHYYQIEEVQDIGDFVGDSLALSQEAANTNADIILFAGVHFMAETAKILSPDKKVIIPDLNAGCSLAESCKASDFEIFLKNYPDHTVVSYINTSAEIKALTDIACTSSNAVKIIESLPKDEKIVFAPDRNLGNYINSVTNRNMVIWDGACHVHEEFSLEGILELKSENPGAKIIAHPECEKPILLVADHIGSTSSLLKFTQTDSNDTYIIATEPGVIHQMKKSNPNKNFIPAPPKDSTCGCNDCSFMKLINLKKIYNSLLYELPEVNIDVQLRERALQPVIKMLELSNKLKI